MSNKGCEVIVQLLKGTNLEGRGTRSVFDEVRMQVSGLSEGLPWDPVQKDELILGKRMVYFEICAQRACIEDVSFGGEHRCMNPGDAYVAPALPSPVPCVFLGFEHR